MDLFKKLTENTIMDYEVKPQSLREQIRTISAVAADRLKKAGVDDAELLTLTRQDLHELLPEFHHFQSRRKIMEVIDKSLQSKPQRLREQIRAISAVAADRLKKAGVDDAELLTLTRQDLHELLPECEHFQTRRKIMEVIDKSSQEANTSNMDPCTESPQDLIPKEDMRKLQVPDGLHDHRRKLKALEKQLLEALDLLRPHIELLDKLVEQKVVNQNSACATPLTSLSQPSLPFPHIHCRLTVKIHTVVCGVTLNAHLAFINGLGLQIEECTKEECSVILVFCPVSTRMGTDVEAALNKIPKDKDAILVVMHHSFTPAHIKVMTRTPLGWKNIVETVDCLIHDSAGNGLVNCTLNDHAVLRVRTTLEKYM
ncbi:uncharacterized protein si:ch211-245h14.1 [Megalops cyprinoides]|uniref:uncharacterized protein si:ch211-245h14.1 n=1 Tax=Megalops cyprinoides TaxID=118141 RepID=UPI0018647E51|nr:uncharacterized protein si:ch211-245h14.1 [Megalops cyprinoides]